jgi:hypothetical protein
VPCRPTAVKIVEGDYVKGAGCSGQPFEGAATEVGLHSCVVGEKFTPESLIREVTCGRCGVLKRPEGGHRCGSCGQDV